MKEFKGELDKGPMRRSPTLAMVGGRCIYDQHHGGGGELFSSEVNSSFMEVGSKEAQCVRRLELKKGLSPCWKELGAAGLYGRSSRGGIQFRMESWASPTSSSPRDSSSSSFQINCSRSGSATQAAVLVLYYCVSLGVIF